MREIVQITDRLVAWATPAKWLLDEARAKRIHANTKRRLLLTKQKAIKRETLLEIAKEQEFQCFYCDRDMGDKWTIDHYIPLSKGGEHTKSNLVACCQSCNSIKGNKIPTIRVLSKLYMQKQTA